MMNYRLSPRAGSVVAAAILGAFAGAAHHHDTASGPRRLDALVGARARGRPVAPPAVTSAPLRRDGDFWTDHDADEPFHLGTAISTDAAGRVHVAGLSTSADRPGLRATVARLLPDGAYAWSRTCTGSGALSEPHITVGPEGAVAVALTFQGQLDCGAGPIAAAGGDDDFDAVVLRLDPTGRLLWLRSLSDIGPQIVASVAFDPWGGVVLAGSFEGTIDLGGSPLAAESERDVLLARLDPDGDLVWQKRFGTTGHNFGVDVDVAPSGRIALLARSDAGLDLGTGELTCPRPSTFVAGFDLAGHPIWSRKLSGTGEVLASDLAVLQADRVVVTGAFTGDADLGTGILRSAGGSDIFVVKLGPSGEAVWSSRFGDQAEQAAFQIAGGPGGRVALTGRFDGHLDFGQGPLRSQGGDLFVAKLAATGHPLWSLRTADPSLSAGLAITMDAAGQVLATGPTPETPTFPSPPSALAPVTAADLFAARLGP